MLTIRMTALIAAVMLCSSAVVIHSTGSAVAQEDAADGPAKKGKRGKPGPPGPPGPTTFALIEGTTGAVLRSSPGVTTGGPASPAGTYLVRFPDPVNTCVGTASMSNSNLAGSTTTAPGETSVAYEPGNPNGLVVRTFNSAGTAGNRSFMLIVACNP